MSKRKKIEVHNAGPIEMFAGEYDKPGMYLLTGGNGEGKSHVLNLIRRATGSPVDVEVRDGAKSGYFKMDDVILVALSRSKTANKGGAMIEASLASTTPLEDLINPGIQDPKRRETARVKALLSVVSLEMTKAAITDLLDNDEGAADAVAAKMPVEHILSLDPVTAADRMKRVIESEKRDFEAEADKAEGERLTWAPKVPLETESAHTVNEAQEVYNKLVGDVRELEGQASQREARERERAEIQETIGDSPDKEGAKADLAAAEAALRVASTEVTRLEMELALAKQSEQARIDGVEAALAHLSGVLVRFDRWVKERAILDAPITGATQDDVQKARQAVTAALSELDLARATETYRLALSKAEAARRNRDEYRKVAIRYDNIAKSLPARLGGLLKSAGLEGVTVEDGVLRVTQDGQWEDFERLSDGEKARMAIPWWVTYHPQRLAAFSEDFWLKMEPESRVEIARIIEEHGILGTTETPSRRGEALKLEYFDWRAEAESLGVEVENA